MPVRVASFPGAFLTAGRGAREVPAADSGQRYDACHERDDRRDQQDAVQAGGEGGDCKRSSEESGGWLMVEVGGEGIAESPAGGCEVVAGEGGGVGGRHDARVGDQ